MTDLLGRLLGRDAIEKRIRALEAWRDQHMEELGSGGAAQRIAELLELRKQVMALADKLTDYEAALAQSIRTSNDNLGKIMSAITGVERSLKEDFTPLVKMLSRVQERVGRLEFERIEDRE